MLLLKKHMGAGRGAAGLGECHGSLDLYLFSGLSFPLAARPTGHGYLSLPGRWTQAWTREGGCWCDILSCL